MSDKKEGAKSRAALLKSLREKHKVTVERTQTLLKETNAVRKRIREAMESEPRTVPEIAEGTGLPADQVLWHVTAMKKYDLIRDVGMSGEYYQYELTQEETQ
jgi:predicted transcriptional regulator